MKVADRYPFLIPFGDEFEYLAGEIAFIGTASPSPFISVSPSARIAVPRLGLIDQAHNPPACERDSSRACATFWSATARS